MRNFRMRLHPQSFWSLSFHSFRTWEWQNTEGVRPLLWPTGICDGTWYCIGPSAEPLLTLALIASRLVMREVMLLRIS